MSTWLGCRAVVALALSTAGAGVAQSLAAQGDGRRSNAATVDSARLARFVDSVITAEMTRQRIPGAAFVLVHRGRVLYARGYGVASVEPRRPVDPARTIWRVGSISKTFTATAVAQLAGRGVLHLGADVNGYLKGVTVPSTYPLPVTVTDLLTHTSGFDEVRPGTQAPTEDQVLPLADFLRPRLVRVRPPGTFIAYNTYGITLAGALIESATGTAFESFLRTTIWEPLGMSSTSITVPSAQRTHVALGYELRGESLVPQPWEWYHTTPASSVNSTAMDMARYMIAHLEGGRIGDRRAWPESVAVQMMRQHVTIHARVPGVTLGFFEDYVGALRVVEHGGNMAGFSSQMTLIPSEHAGFFIVSHLEGATLRDALREALLKWLYPAARVRHPVPTPAPDFASRAKAFLGRYAPTIGCNSCTPRRVPYVVQVTLADNALFMFGKRWIEVDPLVFVREDGTGHIAFQLDSSGRVASMSAGAFWSFEKLPDGGTDQSAR
ncbi:MAG TPA: serine hydrolase domain-containing protein [Gemmatimonadaceae bacterium]|nr:serine hydrolase domain-containing protein [Gemmatimonadaceae bacterium]